MVVSLRHFRSDLTTVALILAIIGADDSAASLDSATDLVVVVTDGVNPATGLCAGYRKSEENSSNIHHQEFQWLLKEMVSLLNAVIKEKMNGSSSLVLLETGCEDGVDVIIQKIIDLMATNQVKGVVTITRGHADRIVEVLQYWNVPVVEMVSADVITRESSGHNHFIIPHYAYWQIKHVMLTADVFNWTALTISYHGQSSSTFSTVKDLFTSLASKNGVCILPKHFARDVPTVIFQHEGNVSSTLAATGSGTVLVVGNPASISEDFENRHEQSVLHLYAQNRDGQHLMKAINVACNITSVKNSVYSASEHNFKSLCAYPSSLNTTSFDVKSYLEGLLASISFLLSKSEVFMGPLSCNSSNISLECLLSGSSETMLDEKSNVIYLSRNMFEVDYLNNKNSSQQFGFKLSKYGTLSLPEYIPSAVFSKNCEHVCDKCVRCFPSTFADTNIMTSGQGDSVIVAFFPIHVSTQEGLCGQPYPARFFASLVFLETIKSYSSTRNIPGVQGVVFDSCGSLGEVTSVLHSLETCKFYFKEEVGGINISRSFAQSSIIGYVNGFNIFSLPHASNDKFSLNLHDFGYSTGIDFSQQFINNILAALSKIGWTVINVLVSDHEPFRTFSKLLNASPLSGKFCFVNQIVIHEDATLQEIDLVESLRSMNQTPASLLLTSLEDSILVLQKIRKHAEHMTSKSSLVLTQWNLAVDVNGILPYVDVIIKFTPDVKNVSQTTLNSLRSALQSSQSVWSREFSNTSLATFLTSPELAVVVEATEKLVDSLEASYNTGASMRDTNLGPTGLRVSALYADKNYESEIAYMNTTTSVFAPFSGPSFNVCKGWCPACLACPGKDTAQTTNLYLEGDILITGIFAIHQKGETAFSCGSSKTEVEKLLKVQSFMFAVETFKMRYPALLPGLRIGGLVLDSCSNPATALKVIGNFETCTLNFKGSSSHSSQDTKVIGNLTEKYSKYANPSTNVAYILDFPGDSIQLLNATLQAAQLQNALFINNIQSLSPYTASFQFIQAIVRILINLGWDKIIIISGNSYDFLQDVNALIAEAHSQNICVVATFHIESILLPVRSHFESYQGMPLVLLSSKEDSEIMFDSLKAVNDSYIWIIPKYHQSWSRILDKQDYFPLGSIVIEKKSKENEQYNIFLHNLTRDPDFVRSLSSWFQDLWRLRFSCYFPGDNFQELDKTQECPFTAPASDLNITSPEVHDTILHVDAVLHSFHAKYMDKCLQGYGVCDQVADAVRNKSLSLGPDVTFDYQGEQLEYTFDGQPATMLSVFSYQRDGSEKIGSYFKFTLTLNVTQIRFYTADGSELNTVPRAACVSDCQCLTASPVNGTYFAETHPYVYVTTGEFIDDLWVIIALAIGGLGSLLSLIFAIYVVYKVTKKALGKRFVSLGLTLLFSVALLYLSILPFAFTPSEAICGLRYFLTGVSYTSCFAVILVKLMSLQSYKLIGLGGEVSKINQFLTTFFIVGVQIAIGVQWWLNNDPTMYSIIDSSGIQKYICNFNRQDFVAYHAYVMLLVLICCIYAISVRNEKKNMGEARLLLACCCTCVIIWATWLPCLVLLDRKWSDAIICAGILSCATAVLVIIFVPKIRMVSRLKYDLSQKTNVRNGHSLDTDFLYERPYSLPGTLTSTFSSAKMNYPKTASSFDADVNY